MKRLGLGYLLLSCQFRSIFGVLASHVLYRILACSSRFFLFRGLAVDAVSDEDRSYKHGTDDVVFVHFLNSYFD